MDVGLLRQRGVEVDAKNSLNPDESGNKDGAWDGPVGRDDRMGSECQTSIQLPSEFRAWRVI